MQVNATLIAAQLAAREAQARFQATHVAPKSPSVGTPSFAAALEDDIFKPLDVKQAAAPSAPALGKALAAAAGRPGSQLDITV